MKMKLTNAKKRQDADKSLSFLFCVSPSKTPKRITYWIMIKEFPTGKLFTFNRINIRDARSAAKDAKNNINRLCKLESMFLLLIKPNNNAPNAVNIDK
jgi:hypothetical protein